jgi:hypothetical protein
MEAADASVDEPHESHVSVEVVVQVVVLGRNSFHRAVVAVVDNQSLGNRIWLVVPAVVVVGRGAFVVVREEDEEDRSVVGVVGVGVVDVDVGVAGVADAYVDDANTDRTPVPAVPTHPQQQHTANTPVDPAAAAALAEEAPTARYDAHVHAMDQQKTEPATPSKEAGY